MPMPITNEITKRIESILKKEGVIYFKNGRRIFTKKSNVQQFFIAQEQAISELYEEGTLSLGMVIEFIEDYTPDEVE